MEGEAGSEGHNRGGADDNSNDNNGSNSKIANSNEGQSKPKRKMKTPFQLQNLEKAYALDTYPSEAMRLELSEKLGLSDRQLQTWFCHRRLKDKKDLPPRKRPRKVAAEPLPDSDLPPKKRPRKVAAELLPDSPTDDMRLDPELGNEYGSGSGSGSSPLTRSESRNAMPQGLPGYYESPQAGMERRAIASVEAQLGEPLREDGPILGVEFDPLPPDAFGAPIVTEQRKRPSLAYDSKIYDRHDMRANKALARTFHEYQFLPNQSGIRSDAFGQFSQPHLHDPMEGPARNPPFVVGNEQLPRIHATTKGHSSRPRLLSQQDKQGIPYQSPTGDKDDAPQTELYTNIANIGMNSHFTDHQIVGPESPSALPSGQVLPNNMRIEKKRKSDDARITREVEAHEMKIRKEHEKQDNLRRKSEERMKKEMERQDRERRKEEERLMRERQREEERTKREQKREIERREKHLLKENLRAEKLRQKEELRKEKEAERRKAALEKATARRMAKESMELIEDEQLELMELAASSKGFSSIIRLDFDTLQNLESYKDSLCVLPPKSVKLRKPFAIQPWINSEENVGNLLMKLPSRYNPFKSPKVVEPEPADSDHDDLMKVKSAPMKIARSSNKRGRGSHDKGRGKKLSKRMRDSKRDTSRNVKVTENLSQRIKQQGRGSQGQAGGRGRRTVRKRRVEKRAVEDLLLGHGAASHSSSIGREPLRSLDEDWDDRKASPMTPIHMGAADISNSAEEAESDDNAQAVESDDNAQAMESDDSDQAVAYDQGNWEIGFNGTPNRWSRHLVNMSGGDVEASEDDNDNGIEEEDSEADVMSEGSQMVWLIEL